MRRRVLWTVAALGAGALGAAIVMRRRDPVGFDNRVRRLRELNYFAGEYVSMQLMDRRRPGPLGRRLFRVPLWMYRNHLDRLVSDQVLLLTTTGRKTGRPHCTPVGYGYDKTNHVYYLSAGWEGRTDWYRNACANPHVVVQVGDLVFNAIARPVAEDVCVGQLKAYSARNPFANRIWSGWIGRPFDGQDETWREVAQHFPMVSLHMLL